MHVFISVKSILKEKSRRLKKACGIEQGALRFNYALPLWSKEVSCKAGDR